MNLMTSKFAQIWDDLKSEFPYSTIKECSLDDSKKDVRTYLVEADINGDVFDFDEIKESWAKNKFECEDPKSLDCLYVKNETLYLVEFKNKVKIKKQEYLGDIKLKIHDSLSMLNYLYGFEKTDFQQIEVIIVSKASSEVQFSKYMNKISGVSCPKALEFIQTIYRIKISKMTNDEFLQKIQGL